MVTSMLINPIHIISTGLGVGFFLGLINKKKSALSTSIMLLALLVMTYISSTWLWAIGFEGHSYMEVFTAGLTPPYSINLLMGKHEAFFTFLINFVALFGGLYLFKQLKEGGKYSPLIYLIMIMGLNVVIMTRDLFNLFVFLEIVSIATAGIVMLNKDVKTFSAGFKYMIATGIISGFLLIGIIFIYYFGGSLNIDNLAMANISAVKGGVVAIFLVVMALVLELKPFPANGWALDIYEAAPGGIGAIISAASATAAYFAISKVLPIAGDKWYWAISYAGIISFIGANLLALKQDNPKRLLGYSSVGQMGLLMVILGLGKQLGPHRDFIIVGMILGHYFAKAGLFWLAGIVKTSHIKGWAIIRDKPYLIFLMGIFIFTLLGLPPFPSFFAKWTLILELNSAGLYGWIWAILIGTFLEVIYLIRWFGYVLKCEVTEVEDVKEREYCVSLNQLIPMWVFGLGAIATGIYSAQFVPGGITLSIFYIPLAFVAFLFIIDQFLPVILKNTISIAAMGLYTWQYLPDMSEFRFIFGIVFFVGGIITMLAGYSRRGTRIGFYPVVMLMYVGLAGLLQATNVLQFFFGWELMTLGSYFLIIRGKKSMPHALSYFLFSQGGAFLLLAGFGMLYGVNNSISLEIIKSGGEYSGIIYLLLATAFLTKTAVMGLHVWLPGAHAEAEADVSPMVSAILLKAGMFGLVILMLAMGEQTIFGISLPYVLSWLGAITALLANILAALEEDAKRLVAYSSIGNLGYVLFAMAFMSHIGWLTAMAFALNHFVFKTILFLAVGGVVYRTKTRNMYEMGGLIKRMPLSFISVMIGIIALSGVPPLTGFAGKWLTFNAVILKKWYLQGFVVSIAGLVAFLYCFRLIFTIFLGQAKDKFMKIKEAPIMILVPQYILIMAVMVFSMMPNMVLQPIGEFLVKYFPDDTIRWEGTKAITSLGYWDGGAIMSIVGGIFVVVFLWLIITMRKSQKVKQFNIVYSAERPSRPETTHFAYNFFAHYKKAIGFLALPLVTDFWNWVVDFIHSLADWGRRIYNGNGQTYALHLIIFVTVFYFFTV